MISGGAFASTRESGKCIARAQQQQERARKHTRAHTRTRTHTHAHTNKQQDALRGARMCEFFVQHQRHRNTYVTTRTGDVAKSVEGRKFASTREGGKCIARAQQQQERARKHTHAHTRTRTHTQARTNKQQDARMRCARMCEFFAQHLRHRNTNHTDTQAKMQRVCRPWLRFGSCTSGQG